MNKNKKLYETIMKDVSKTIKKHLNENVDVNSEEVIDLIIDTLSENDTLYKLAEMVADYLDPHIFVDDEFNSKEFIF
jgi:hypothetical protein